MGHTPYYSDKHDRSTGMEQYLILFFTRYDCGHILQLHEEVRAFIAVVCPCSICGDCNR